MKVRRLRVVITDPYRELLRRYHQIINKKLEERGLEPVTVAQLGGAMLSFLLRHHEQAILDEFAGDRIEAFRDRYGRILDEAGPTGSPEDADVR